MQGDSLLVPTIMGVAMLTIGIFSLLRRFPYRHWAGLRTRATLVSPEAWLAAHVAAAPWMIAGGIAGLLVCNMLAGASLGSPVHGHENAVAVGVEIVFLVASTAISGGIILVLGLGRRTDKPDTTADMADPLAEALHEGV